MAALHRPTSNGEARTDPVLLNLGDADISIAFLAHLPAADFGEIGTPDNRRSRAEIVQPANEMMAMQAQPKIR